MQVCSDSHDEIVYTSRFCPCCDMLNQLDILRTEHDDLSVRCHIAEYRLEELTAACQQSAPELLL